MKIFFFTVYNDNQMKTGRHTSFQVWVLFIHLNLLDFHKQCWNLKCFKFNLLCIDHLFIYKKYGLFLMQ